MPLSIALASTATAAQPSVYVIDHLADGDTVTLRNWQRVRVVQIDTPEVYLGTECYGPQGSATTKRLLLPAPAWGGSTTRPPTAARGAPPRWGTAPRCGLVTTRHHSSIITAIHTLVYSDDPDATRAFLRDVLGWPYVEHPESSPGWLIFKTGPSELGVHPTSGTHEGQDYSYPKHHSISLMCDDIERTVAELSAKDVEFSCPVQDYGFGLGIAFELPGAGEVFLYQPTHPTAYDL